MITEENNAINKNEDEVFVFEDMWKLFVSKWYWFVLSLVTCLAIAIFYILLTTPIYTRSASLLIKDDTKNNSAADAMSGFEDLGFFKSKTNINNEMLSITAPVVMQEVVKRLKLDTEMSMRQGLHTRVLYTDAPIAVTLSGVPDEQSLSFDVELQPNHKVILSHFVMFGQEANSAPIEMTLGSNVRTPFGAVRIIPTSNYTSDFENSTIHVNKYYLPAIAGSYSGRLSVGLGDKEATILNLTLQDPIIQRADDVLRTLIDVYNENWINDKNQVAIATSKFIDGRLSTIEKDLGHVDNSISDFQSRNLLPDVTAVSALHLQQSGKNADMMLTLQNELSMAQYVQKFMSEATHNHQLLPANTGIDNASIEQQIQQYNNTLLDRNNVLSRSSEKNPTVGDYDRALTQMRSAIARSLNNLIAQLNAQVNNIQRNESSVNGQIASSPRQAKFLLSVGRQQKVKESLYLYLLQKREENELSKAYTAYNSRIIQPPMGSFAPTSPKKGVILLAAFALGLVLPGAILMLLENLNTKIRGRKDLANLSIPFIGEIPQGGQTGSFFRKGKPQDRRIVVQEKGRDIMNEAFRIVRAKLDFLNTTSEQMKSVMVTSFNPGSGKSFISMNLAMSMAIQGKHIAYVDLDLRRASASKALLHGSRSMNGISAYLSGHVDSIDDIIVKKVQNDNLDVIPVGVIPPNPTELLLTERLADMINQLKERYDYVFLDCPPVEIVADASIIEKVTDCALFIILVGIMDRRLLPDVEEFYRQGKFKNMAIILNGSEYVSSKYGYRRYSYKYGYGYGGYGYGYGASGYYSHHSS